MLAGVGDIWRRKAPATKQFELDSPDAERRGVALFRQGRVEMRAGKIGDAIRLFDRALATLPDFAEAMAARAEALDVLGRAAEAAPQYEHARYLWAKQRAGAPDRSYIFRQHGRFTFEVDSYELALSRIKTGAFPLLACGNALLVQGRPSEALACYEKAAKLKPNSPDLAALRGEALSMLGRYRDAIAGYNVALAADPKAPEILNARAIAYCALGSIEEANADWRRQLELLAPADFAARAYVALRLAEYQLAVPELERATAAFPDESYWSLYLATARRRLGIAGHPVQSGRAGEWPAALLALHAGQSSIEEALKRADSPARQAETLFQLGVLAVERDGPAAEKHWKDVLKIASPALIEHAAARNELLRLQS